MGTRGSIGIRLNGEDKLTYNHFDSYPDGLGVEILKDLRLAKLEELKKLAENVKLVDEENKPTRIEVIELRKHLDMNVTENRDEENASWYQLLRNLQGDFLGTLKAGYMIDNANFIKDSLFCEWAYIVNFDDNVLEVYEGFQKVKKDIKGRYKNCRKNKGDEYYACSLIKTYPLDSLPTDKQFIADVTPPEED